MVEVTSEQNGKFFVLCLELENLQPKHRNGINKKNQNHLYQVKYMFLVKII